MGLLLNAKMRNGGKRPSVGGNSYLTLVYENGKEKRVSLRVIRNRGDLFYYTSDELLQKIMDIGFEYETLKVH